MKAISLAVSVVFVFLVAAQAGEDDVVKKEQEAIQGKWLWKMESPLSGFNTPPFTVEFMKDGKTVVWVCPGGTIKGTFEVDPRTKPNRINFFTVPEGSILVGSYKIEKGVMTLCLGVGDEGRPTDFVIQKDKRHLVVTAERVK